MTHRDRLLRAVRDTEIAIRDELSASTVLAAATALTRLAAEWVVLDCEEIAGRHHSDDELDRIAGRV